VCVKKKKERGAFCARGRPPYLLLLEIAE